MDITPERPRDDDDSPDELETADGARMPDSTDDDGTPVENPSG